MSEGIQLACNLLFVFSFIIAASMLAQTKTNALFLSYFVPGTMITAADPPSAMPQTMKCAWSL
ncbi:MAG: hypothetical protein INR73_01325 [Williamsia sp.]|nr:hypothetical protein [Williamsia sp.]